MCVCVSVSDREMSSKLENEMRGTPCHTHARSHTPYLTPPVSSGVSCSSVIWRIGQESRLCVFKLKPLLWQ